MLMRLLTLFLAYQHLSSGMNLRECKDQSWLNVQGVPVFCFDYMQDVFAYPRWYTYPRLKPQV
jgi:hypothetical protein